MAFFLYQKFPCIHQTRACGVGSSSARWGCSCCKCIARPKQAGDPPEVVQSSGQCSPCSGCLQKHTSSEGPRFRRDTGGKCSPVAGAAPSPGPPMLGGLLWCCCVSSGVYLLALGGGRLALARLAERWRKLSRFRLRRSCSEAGMAGTCVCGARTVVCGAPGTCRVCGLRRAWRASL